MYENNAGGAVIKGYQNQGHRRDRYHIAHCIGIIKQIENNDSAYEHNSHGKGIRHIHGSVKKARFYLVTHATFGTMFLHLSKIEDIPPLKFKQTALMALWTSGVNGGFQFR